ncbi:MAG: Fe(3+) ABC transporter substrate-binding protein [Burkholderiales bacterium]|nr:Fe(3+) ABC transporter substrate-binding protein [Burkholderiales bacterium]
MSLHRARRALIAVTAAAALSALPAAAADTVLNLYSARHYQTDEALYSDFTKRTGIRINRIEAGDEALLERLRSEGANTPADVLLLVDATRLWRAQIDGMFQPVRSQALEARIPAHLRGKDDGKGAEWFAFSTRARVIVYNKATVKPDQVPSYEDLAAPAFKGKVCTRSGTHPYMLSLIGAMSEHLGEAKAEAWARGVVANFARSPRGGDTDQIKAVATGECGVALTNTYYLVRMMRSDAAADKDAVSKIGMIWPNQQTWGTHVNVSGGGVMRNAPNRAAAVKFLEYLASDSAQAYLADGNNEWPVVATAPTSNPVLASLGKFKADTLPIASVGRAQVTAAKIIDRVGWR